LRRLHDPIWNSLVTPPIRCVSLVESGTPGVFTGTLSSGRGSTVVSAPDGDLKEKDGATCKVERLLNPPTVPRLPATARPPDVACDVAVYG